MSGVSLSQNGLPMRDILSRVQQIIADALSISIELVMPETTASTLGKWDSHRLLFTILALEEEFDIEFEDYGVFGNEAMTVGDVARLIEVKFDRK